MQGAIQLGRVWGIPVGISYSWFLALALVILLLDSYLGNTYPHWGDVQRWATSATVALLFFACIIAHDLAHSLVAIGRGIPVKGIALFIFGGVSKIAREAPSPRVEIAIAIVGPLLSLVLGGLFLALAIVTPFSADPLVAGALILAYTNFGLGLFNLVPGFPLDGGRVLRSMTWRITGDYWKATRISVMAGRLAGVVLALAGLALATRSGTIWPLWLSLVGWFLWHTSFTSLRQVRIQEWLQSLHAYEVLEGSLAEVPDSMSLSELAESAVLQKGQLYCLVGQDGYLQGLLPLSQLRRIPDSRWTQVTVREVMVHLDQLVQVDQSTGALEILDLLNGKGPNPILVSQNGRVIGIVSKEGLTRLVSPRSSRATWWGL